MSSGWRQMTPASTFITISLSLSVPRRCNPMDPHTTLALLSYADRPSRRFDKLQAAHNGTSLHPASTNFPNSQVPTWLITYREDLRVGAASCDSPRIKEGLPSRLAAPASGPC